MVVNSTEMFHTLKTCLLMLGKKPCYFNIHVDKDAKDVKFDGVRAALDGALAGLDDRLITRADFFELFWLSLARVLVADARRGAVISYQDWMKTREEALSWAVKLVDNHMQPQWATGTRSIAVVRSEMASLIAENF